MIITVRLNNTQAGLYPACVRLVMLGVMMLMPWLLVAQTDSVRVLPADTLPPPTTVLFKREATLGRADMLPLRAPLFDISKRDAFHTQYRSMPELLQRQTLHHPVLTGGFGQHDGVRLLGAQSHELTYMRAGRPLADPRTGSMPLEIMSVEDVERMTIIVGSDAVGLGAQPSMQTVSIQPATFDHATPYVRWWYTQGAGDMLATDVTASQNVAPNLNVTLGLRRAGGNGVFDGTDYDVWNFRGSVRIAMSPQTHVLVEYANTIFSGDVWGGVSDAAGSSLSPGTALPLYRNLRDGHRRHDATATISHKLDTAGTSVLSATAWVQRHDLLRLRPETFFVDAQDSVGGNVYRSGGVGGVVRYNQRVGQATVRIGASAQTMASDQGPWFAERAGGQVAAFGHVDMPLGERLALVGAARIDVVGTSAAPGIGAGVVLQPDSASYLRLDVSRSNRARAAVEQVPAGLDAEFMVVFDARRKHSWGDVRFTAWYRVLPESPAMSLQTIPDLAAGVSVPYRLTFDGTAQRVLAGGTVGTELNWLGLRFSPLVRLNIQSDVGTSRSDVQGELRAVYRYTAGSNWVDIGLRGIVFAPTVTDRWVAPQWYFVAGTLERGWITNGLDAELVAAVGNASVRLSYENIFNQPFMTVARAPAIGGNFRLTLTWAFFD